MRRKSIDACFKKHIVPVAWDPPANADLLARASSVFIQGGSLSDLARVLELFSAPQLEHLAVFVHIDLLSGLENNESGLEFLASFNRISGIVTVHHYLAPVARRHGLLSIVRLFLSDSRAVDRGLSVVNKSHPDAVEILPACAATKVANDFASCKIPRIAGGLLRTEADVAEALSSGCIAVTSTSEKLWRLNAP